MSQRTCLLPAVLLLICLQLVSSVPFWNQPQEGDEPPLEDDEPLTIDEAIRKSSAGMSPASFSGRSSDGETIIDGMDMALTEEQYLRLYSGVRGRSAGHTVATPWTDGIIPYEIAPNNFTGHGLHDWILRAMRNWESMACVTFRPAVSSDRNRIIIREGNGCWSHLGMLGGTQIVNLDTNGCFWKGTIEHELGHTLGLIHEHQREQRDAYIRVSYYQVLSGFVTAVKKYARGADDKMGLPYDYTSVMHYGKTAFSKDGYSQTLFTRDPTKQDVIGMILWGSFIDAKLVNLMYKCADKCHSPPSCPDRCFVAANCSCICAENMPREHCRDLNDTCPQMKNEGRCHVNYGYMHHYCRKSCGICKTDGSMPQLPCVNGNEKCDLWQSWGHCVKNAGYMLRRCRLACGVCKVGEDYTPKGPCEDKNSSCPELAAKGGCVRDTANMLKNCTKSCDFCPEDVGDDPSLKPGCVDYDSICYYWADSNLCQKHYAWMVKNCRQACHTCHNASSIVPADCVDNNLKCFDNAFKDWCYHYPKDMEDCKLSCSTCKGLVRPPEKCLDYNFSCKWWAEQRYECWGNPGWMGRNCKKSCKQCPGDPPQPKAPCMDYRGECPSWKDKGECQNNPRWMKDYCKVSCGVCQSDGSGDCVDYNERCADWASSGECENNPNYMLNHCKKSCRPECKGSNGTEPCVDENSECPGWASYGECGRNPSYMLKHCKKSCKQCESTETETCVDRNTHCPEWAAHEQCERNPSYMLSHCRKSCRQCSSTEACIDENSNCPDWAAHRQCEVNPGYMLHHCKKSCHQCS